LNMWAITLMGNRSHFLSQRMLKSFCSLSLFVVSNPLVHISWFFDTNAKSLQRLCFDQPILIQCLKEWKVLTQWESFADWKVFKDWEVFADWKVSKDWEVFADWKVCTDWEVFTDWKIITHWLIFAFLNGSSLNGAY
jgi:hypothetical protein